MAKQFTTFKIECSTNPDWNGTWYAQEVKQEMEEVGAYHPSGNDWIEYVIGYLDFPPEVDDIVANDITIKYVCNIDGNVVYFIKK